MAYAYPENMTNFTSYAAYFNTVTDGWFWPLIIIAFGVTVLLYLIRTDQDLGKVTHTTALLTFILGGILYAGTLISPQILLILFIAWGLSAWWFKASRT